MNTAPCLRCGAPVSFGARFCPSCAAPVGAQGPQGFAGHPVPAPAYGIPANAVLHPSGGAPVSLLPPLRVCAGCGIVAPMQRTDCSVCKTTFGPQPTFAPGAVGNALFARVHQCDFQCRSCGLRTPLPTVDLDGEVECARCATIQAFDVVQWTEALTHAHNTADLAGPSPEGRFPNPARSIAARNTYAKIGNEHTSSTYEQSTTIITGAGMTSRTLRTSISPGHPLCATCKSVLQVGISIDRSTVETICARCNERARYTLPKGASEIYPALRGVLAGEQREDRPAARVTTSQAGVEAIACPQCGASLQVGAGEMVTCQYCRCTARVPRRLGNRARGTPVFEPFWVLLEGPSPGRSKLERGKAVDADDDDDDDDDEDFDPGSAPSPDRVQQQVAAQIANTNNLARMIIGLSVGAALLITAVVVGVVLYGQMSTPTPPPRKTTTGRGH